MGTFNLPPLDGSSPPEKELTQKREEVVKDSPSFFSVEGIVVEKETSGTLTTFKIDTDDGLVYALKAGADDDSIKLGSIIECELDSSTKMLVNQGEYSYKGTNFEVLYTPPENVSSDEIIDELKDDEEEKLSDTPPKKLKASDIVKNKRKEEDALSDSIPQPETDNKDGKYSFMDSIKAAIAEVKAELADGKNGASIESDDDDFEDEYEDQQEEEEKPKPKKKGKGKKKIKNPFKGIVSLYKKIALFIFNVLMKPIDFLSHIPIIGRLFKLIKKVSFILMWICYLWLPILFLIFSPLLSISTPSLPSKQNTKPDKVETKNIVAEKDDTSIEVMKVTTGKNPTITIKNHSKLYSNFYGEVTFEKPSFFGKKVKCETPITLIGIEEEKTLKLKCKNELKTEKVKSFDIITEYNK